VKPRLLLALCLLPALLLAWERPLPLGSMWPEQDPALSADGRYLAFVRTTEAGRDLFLLDMTESAGTPARQLTTHPAADYRPSFLADGSGLVFISARDDAHGDIFFLPLSKRFGSLRVGSPRLLLKRLGSQDHPQLALDGTLYWDEETGFGRSLMQREKGDIPRLLLEKATRPRLFQERIYALRPMDSKAAEKSFTPWVVHEFISGEWLPHWAPAGGVLDYAFDKTGQLILCAFDLRSTTGHGKSSLWRLERDKMPRRLLDSSRHPRQLVVHNTQLIFLEESSRPTLYKLTHEADADDCQEAARHLSSYREAPKAPDALLHLQSLRGCESFVHEALLLEYQHAIHRSLDSSQALPTFQSLFGAELQTAYPLLSAQSTRIEKILAHAFSHCAFSEAQNFAPHPFNLQEELNALAQADLELGTWLTALLAPYTNFIETQSLEGPFEADLLAHRWNQAFEKGQQRIADSLGQKLIEHFPLRKDLCFEIYKRELALLHTLSREAKEEFLAIKCRDSEGNPAWALAWQRAWILHCLDYADLRPLALHDLEFSLARDLSDASAFEAALQLDLRLQAANALRKIARLSEGFSLLEVRPDMAYSVQDRLFEEQATWHLSLAKDALRAQDPSLAALEALRAEAAAPDDWQPMRLRIAALVASGSPIAIDAEEERLRAQLDFDPEHVLSLYGLGFLLSWRAENEAAFLPESDAHLEYALSLDPEFAPAYLTLSWNLGRALQLANQTHGGLSGLWKQFKRSREAFERVRFKGGLSSLPEDADALRARAISLVERGLDLCPEEEKGLRLALWQNLGSLHFSLGEYGAPRAMEAWAERFALDSTFTHPTQRLHFIRDFGTALHWNAEYAAAQNLLEEARDLAESQGESLQAQRIRARLALLMYERKDYPAALRAFESLLESEVQGGQRAFLLRNIALTQSALGRREEVRAALDQAAVAAQKSEWPLRADPNWLSLRFPGMSIPIWNFPRLSFGEARVDWGAGDEQVLRLSLESTLLEQEGKHALLHKSLRKQAKLLKSQGDLSGMLLLNYRRASLYMSQMAYLKAAKRFESVAKQAKRVLPASDVRRDALQAAMRARALSFYRSGMQAHLSTSLLEQSRRVSVQMQDGSLLATSAELFRFDLHLLQYESLLIRQAESVEADLKLFQILSRLESMQGDLSELTAHPEIGLAFYAEYTLLAQHLGESKRAAKALSHLKSLSSQASETLLADLLFCFFDLSEGKRPEADDHLNDFREHLQTALQADSTGCLGRIDPAVLNLLLRRSEQAALQGASATMHFAFTRWAELQNTLASLPVHASASLYRPENLMPSRELACFDSTLHFPTGTQPLQAAWPEQLHSAYSVTPSAATRLSQRPAALADSVVHLDFAFFTRSKAQTIRASRLVLDAKLLINPLHPASAELEFEDGFLPLQELAKHDFHGAEIVFPYWDRAETMNYMPIWFQMESLCLASNARAFLLANTPKQALGTKLLQFVSLEDSESDYLRLGASEMSERDRQICMRAELDATHPSSREFDDTASLSKKMRALQLALQLDERVLAHTLFSKLCLLALKSDQVEEYLDFLLEAQKALAGRATRDAHLRRLSLLADRANRPELADSLWAACKHPKSSVDRVLSLSQLEAPRALMRHLQTQKLEIAEAPAALQMAKTLVQADQHELALQYLLDPNLIWSQLSPSESYLRFTLQAEIFLAREDVPFASGALKTMRELIEGTEHLAQEQGEISFYEAQLAFLQGDLRLSLKQLVGLKQPDLVIDASMQARAHLLEARCLTALLDLDSAWDALVEAMTQLERDLQPALQLKIFSQSLSMSLRLERSGSAEHLLESARNLLRSLQHPSADLRFLVQSMEFEWQVYRADHMPKTALGSLRSQLAMWIGTSLHEQTHAILTAVDQLRSQESMIEFGATEKRALASYLNEDAKACLKFLKKQEEKLDSAGQLRAYHLHTRALCELRLGRQKAAKTSLDRAIDLARKPWENGKREGLWRSEEMASLVADRADLAFSQRDPKAAWFHLDRYRRLAHAPLLAESAAKGVGEFSLDVIQAALAVDQELLTWTWNQERTLLLRLTRQGLQAYPLRVKADDLLELIENFQRSGASTQLSEGDAKALYAALFEPFVHDQITLSDRVICITSWPLAQLSFAALQTASGHYLGQEHSFSRSPSLWALNHSRLLHEAYQERANSHSPQIFLSAHDPTLPFASLESQSVQVSFPESQIPDDSSVHSFLGESSFRPFRHFIGHAKLDPFSLVGSQLVFPNSPERTESESPTHTQRLNALELARLKLPTRLLSLSACESVAKGSTVWSPDLALSAQLAGSQMVLGSLRKVQDLGASLLAKHFYRELSKGQPADLALAIAKRHLMKLDGAHPKDWGAFVLQGWPSALPTALAAARR
jgi:hypothetical protein